MPGVVMARLATVRLTEAVYLRFVCRAEAFRDEPFYGSSNGLAGSTAEHFLRGIVEKHNLLFRVDGDNSRP